MRDLRRGCWIVIGCALLLLPLHGGARGLAYQTPLATLDPVQGLIQSQTGAENPADPQSWHTVTTRIILGEGDRIRTDGAGVAYLTFFDGISSQVGPNTIVIVSTLALPAPGTVDVTFDVLVGSTLSTVEAAVDPSDRIEIHTPSATAVVRGTRWWTVVQPDGSVTFSAERGTVQIIPNPLHVAGVAPPAEETPQAAVPVLPETFDLRAGTSLVANRFGVVESILQSVRAPVPPPPQLLAGQQCGDGICQWRDRLTCPYDCTDRATLTACGDGVCDPSASEDLLLCPQDCGPFAGAQCGNGTCNTDESGITCPQDCAPGQYFSPVNPRLCGNAICDPTESSLTCPGDCSAAGE